MIIVYVAFFAARCLGVDRAFSRNAGACIDSQADCLIMFGIAQANCLRSPFAMIRILDVSSRPEVDE